MKIHNVITAFAFALASVTPVDSTVFSLRGERSAAPERTQVPSSCAPKDIDVCIAIDRSGSICAPPGSSTYSCGGAPDCGCENWDFVRKFTGAFIDSSSASEKERNYSIVKFATTARVESPLTNAKDAFNIVSNLQYTSGWTNTAQAIEKCREELNNTVARGQQKAIVLLTDGAPTRPLDSDHARTKAEEQATYAKEEEDTDIIGVFVNTESGERSFLETLTTPGHFLEVTDFSDLNGFNDKLLNLLECPQTPPPPPILRDLPTRECEQEEMDVCIALDRSGSVCRYANGTYPQCNGDPNCGDSCPEWQATIEYTKNFIRGLGAGLHRFALVGFASKAEEVSDWVDAKTAYTMVDDFAYTGGWTATGDAIDTCRLMLQKGAEFSDAEKTIVIITDGSPTRPDTGKVGSPYTEAKEHALVEASEAKNEDITIVGVFVDTGSKTTSILKEMVTPGFHLEVGEFDELAADSNNLVQLVKCDAPAPSAAPSSSPSSAPSSFPTISPTASPTCKPKDLDVCVAIDRSGSICPLGDGKYLSCNGRDPSCTCDNWEASTKFAESFISGADQADGEQQFALVTFSTNAELQTETGLVDGPSALKTLNSTHYRGGWTNTMEALQYCRKVLSRSDKQTAIVLVTDGIPTRPENRDVGTARATEQAVAVKKEKTTLITVAVNTGRRTSAYLKELASPGFDVKVDNFDELDALQGRVSSLLSCA